VGWRKKRDNIRLGKREPAGVDRNPTMRPEEEHESEIAKAPEERVCHSLKGGLCNTKKERIGE